MGWRWRACHVSDSEGGSQLRDDGPLHEEGPTQVGSLDLLCVRDMTIEDRMRAGSSRGLC